MGGGVSQNNLWNTIRASVLNKPLSVSANTELSLYGLITYITMHAEENIEMPRMDFYKVLPDKQLVKIYAEKYAEFIHYQKLIYGLKE